VAIKGVTENKDGIDKRVDGVKSYQPAQERWHERMRDLVTIKKADSFEVSGVRGSVTDGEPGTGDATCLKPSRKIVRARVA